MRVPLERIGSVTDWQGGETMSAAALRERATHVAATLKERGFGPGEKVLIYHGGDGRIFADLFGVWRAGTCAACLKPSLAGEELKNIAGQGEGEILVQSPSVMKAYYKRPDETAEAIRDGWFHTGDIGRIDGNGLMRITGRRKYEINRGGLKVHPEDIDLLLERHEAVREACAFSIPDDAEGETVGVAVSPTDGADVDLRKLRRWCAERISREKVPHKWFVLDGIPTTDRGKLDRDAVAARCLARAPER